VKRKLDNEDLLRLLDRATIEALDIKANTILALKMPEIYLPGVSKDIVHDVQLSILELTGLTIPVLALRSDLELESWKEQQLVELRDCIDLALAHLAIQKQKQRTAN